MKIKEIVQLLIDAPSYKEVRLYIDDSVIELLRDHMPSYYDLIREKEELFLNERDMDEEEAHKA